MEDSDPNLKRHSTFRIDVPLVLPQVGDAQDGCVARLIAMLEDRAGVTHIHVTQQGKAFPNDVFAREARLKSPDSAELRDEPQLCLHYDPDQLSLNTLVSLILESGAELRGAYGHATFAVNKGRSEGRSGYLLERLLSLPGVTQAEVSEKDGVARVEFALTETNREDIAQRIQRLGFGVASF